MEFDFQRRVRKWLLKCFSVKVATNQVERNHRFLEEALELVQSLGCTKQEALVLVDYVFDREAGDPVQECGGVMVTLAALCFANKIEMETSGEVELLRISDPEVMKKIQKKQAAKPKFDLPAQYAHADDEKYCPNCGTIIPKKSDCPACYSSSSPSSF